MDLFKRDDDEKEKELGKTIANLSEQIGKLQQQLLERNKQIDKLTEDLGSAQTKAQSASAAQASDHENLQNTQQVLKDAQSQVRALEKQIGDLSSKAREAAAAATATKAPAAGVSLSPEAGHAKGGTLGAAAPAAGGLAAGASAWVQKAGGKNLRRRNAPGLNSDVLDGLAPGTQLTLLEGPNDADGYSWWRVRAADGREGWVAGQELVTQPE